MNTTIKQALYYFGLFGLLVFTSSYYGFSNDFKKIDEARLSQTPDMFVHNIKVRTFDAKGALANQLTSPFMEHFPQDNTHVFTTPRILVKQADEPAWTIQSKKAKAIFGGQQITFTEEVIVHQKPGAKNQESTIATEKIVYFPKEKKATTDLLVTYTQSGNKVQSTGMNADLAEKRLQLLQKAKGYYAPKVG
jgi:lipopolysaccharide export system protein LptC